MNLNNRITRLEQRIQRQPCVCPDNADLAWPGHHPDLHCPRCGGERLIYLLSHFPRQAEAQLRAVLPILTKTYDGSDRPDYSKLTDHELQQLKQALQAAELNGAQKS
jgi:hypothetical protein